MHELKRIGYLGLLVILTAIVPAACNYPAEPTPTASSLPFRAIASPEPTSTPVPRIATPTRGLETIRITNLDRLQPVMRVQDSSGISQLAFSPDGELLAVGTSKPSVNIWSVRGANLVATLSGHQGAVPAVAFSPDGKVLATGSWDRTIRLWRVADWSLIRSWTAHDSYVRTLAYSPDGKLLASGGEDNAVNVWSADGSQRLFQLLGSGISVNAIAFSPDSSLLVSAYGDSKARVWSMTDGSLLRSLVGFSNTSSLAYNQEGTLLAGGSWSYSAETLKPLGRIAFWNPENGDRLYGTEMNTGALALVFSVDDSLLFSTTSDDQRFRLRAWRASDGRWLQDWGGIADRPFALGRNPAGTILVTGAEDGELQFWSIE
ncbi:MAG: WD40 repeat domain-containing protein [Anaerolineales bacterium]